MEDNATLALQLRRERDALQYKLETLGGAARLAHRGKIDDVERRLRDAETPGQPAASAGGPA